MEEINEIRDDYVNGKIDANKAFWKVLDLLAVSGSFSDTDMERAYDDGYSTEGEITFDIENYR